MGVTFDDDAVGADDQQAAKGPLAHLRRCSEPLLAAGRMLPGREPEPCRKVSSLTESLGRWRKGRYGRRDQRADAGHRHQSPRHVVLLGATGALGIELPDLRLELR